MATIALSVADDGKIGLQRKLTNQGEHENIMQHQAAATGNIKAHGNHHDGQIFFTSQIITTT